ncbi:MAG: hypothetical protein CMI70_04200 [Candidatus Pelagibacter sp.]|nr:hypothetical protein [Candidatus Pelagibacter sp.]MDP6440624.1 hypothetical protein [Pelagibacteraceae bacterium]
MNDNNKLIFFFKNQIWHLGGTILLFYLGSQIVDFENNSNAMYTIAMLVWLCFAIISGSKAMFVFAVYSYISIWLHYFATEKEDFKIIYGK